MEAISSVSLFIAWTGFPMSVGFSSSSPLGAGGEFSTRRLQDGTSTRAVARRLDVSQHNLRTWSRSQEAVTRGELDRPEGPQPVSRTHGCCFVPGGTGRAPQDDLQSETGVMRPQGVPWWSLCSPTSTLELHWLENTRIGFPQMRAGSP